MKKLKKQHAHHIKIKSKIHKNIAFNSSVLYLLQTGYTPRLLCLVF